MNIRVFSERVAEQFLRNEDMRRYTCRDGKQYVLEFERDEEDPAWLAVTTWGHDYEGLRIPDTYSEMIALRVAAMGNIEYSRLNVNAEVAFKFYDAIFRAANRFLGDCVSPTPIYTPS